MHLSCLANSYFYNYKPSTCTLHQHRLLRNLRKNKDIFIMKPNKGNGVVILDKKLYNNAIQETISDTSKFKKFTEDPTLKHEASLQHFLHKAIKKYKLFNVTNFILVLPTFQLKQQSLSRTRC